MKVTYKDAVKAARDYANEIYGLENLRGFRVEEIAPSDDQKHWKVTLGWVEPDIRVVNPSSAIYPIRGEVVEAPRVYKKFIVDGETGAVVSMMMRE